MVKDARVRNAGLIIHTSGLVPIAETSAAPRRQITKTHAHLQTSQARKAAIMNKAKQSESLLGLSQSARDIRLKYEAGEIDINERDCQIADLTRPRSFLKWLLGG